MIAILCPRVESVPAAIGTAWALIGPMLARPGSRPDFAR